jgi:peptidoglycan hydrolase CwlO-like protein
MKKLCILSIAVSLFLVAGCGPKGASSQTLMALSTGKRAAEAAEAKAKEVEKQRIELEAEIKEKEDMVKNLEQELESIRSGIKEGGE